MKTSSNISHPPSIRRGIFSVIIGLALAILLQFGASYLVSAQTSEPSSPSLPANVNINDVVSFIDTTSNHPVKRIGSLAVGGSSVPNWININNLGCIRHLGTIPQMINSCLDVSQGGGSASFSKLWVMPKALVNKVFVTNTTQTEPGWIEGFGFGPNFIIADLPGTNDSMMISGLGRYSGGSFNPQNLTTLRNVCATTNGMMVPCTGPNPVNGQCGSAHGGSFSAAPGSGFEGGQSSLCATGSASTVTDNGALTDPRYTWTCSGANGGSNASCSASYNAPITPVNGVCKDYSGLGQGYTTQPATNNATGCDAGIYADIFPDTATHWLWRCNGINGGTNATNCSAPKPAGGSGGGGDIPNYNGWYFVCGTIPGHPNNYAQWTLGSAYEPAPPGGNSNYYGSSLMWPNSYAGELLGTKNCTGAVNPPLSDTIIQPGAAGYTHYCFTAAPHKCTCKYVGGGQTSPIC